MSWLWLSLSGILAGVLGGLLGVGGASVMIPAMLWILGTQYTGILGFHHRPYEGIHQYQATSLIVTSLLILPSVRVHVKNRAVWTGVLKWLVPAALLGGLAGAALSESRWLARENVRNMNYLVGVFFLYVVVDNVLRLLAPRREAGLPRELAEACPWWRKGIVGFFMGVSAGLLGVGGGVVAVPAQQAVLRMPLRNSIATSAAAILCTGWTFAIFRNLVLPRTYAGVDSGQLAFWQHSVLLAALLTPTAMIGGYLGGHLAHRLPVKWIRVVFIALMLLSAGKAFSPLWKKPAAQQRPVSAPAPARTSAASDGGSTGYSVANPALPRETADAEYRTRNSE